VANRQAFFQTANSVTPKSFHPDITGPIVKHIPKSARPACCSELTSLINSIIRDSQNSEAWIKLLHFCPTVLSIPSKTGSKRSISDTIKDRISTKITASTKSLQPNSRTARSFDLARAVSSKIEDGNIKGALSMLVSDDKPAPAQLLPLVH